MRQKYNSINQWQLRNEQFDLAGLGGFDKSKNITNLLLSHINSFSTFTAFVRRHFYDLKRRDRRVFDGGNRFNSSVVWCHVVWIEGETRNIKYNAAFNWISNHGNGNCRWTNGPNVQFVRKICSFINRISTSKWINSNWIHQQICYFAQHNFQSLWGERGVFCKSYHSNECSMTNRDMMDY